jgi:hypothetical protein
MINGNDVDSIEAAMTAKAKAVVIANGDWLAAQELSTSDKDAVPILDDLLCIEHDGKFLYPSWALEGRRMFEPLRTIVDLFWSNGTSSWNIAIWFASNCSNLGDLRPQDVLRASPMDVVAAVKGEIVGITHG